jgi:dTDP-4-dehydrorhamnose reductase
LARQGYRVVITARPGSSALEAALISIASCGPAPIGVELALDDLNAAATLVQRVLARVDRIDLLVQNAVYQGELNLRRVTDLSLNDLETAWRASISAPLLVIRAAHQQMLAQSAPGRILIIGSGAGRYDPPAAVDRGGWGFVYGASKAAGEDAVMAACPGALVVRTAWVYGAGGKNFVETMLRLMSTRDSISVVADQVGTPTHTVSLARALLRLAELEISGVHHFTDAGVASWYDFAAAIHDIARARGAVDFGGYFEIKLHKLDDLELFGGGVPHARSSPSAIMLF